MRIRRIVTGHDAAGNAVVLEDRDAEAKSVSLFPGYETFDLWQTEPERTVPHQGPLHEVKTYFPALEEAICRIVTFPPDAALPPRAPPTPAQLAEAEEKAPGLLAHMERDNFGMHTTDSIDFGIVLAGELDLELDDGAKTRVGPGAVIVQNGTRHAWRNPTDQPAMMAFVLLGARRVR